MAVDEKGNLIFIGFNEFGQRTFIGNISESGVFGKTILKVDIILTETVHVIQQHMSQLKRNITLTAKANIITHNSLIRSFRENVYVNVLKSSKLNKTIAERVLLTINRTTNAKREYVVNIYAHDFFNRVFKYVFYETPIVVDSITRKINIQRTVNVIISISINKSFNRTISLSVKAIQTLIKGRAIEFLEHVHTYVLLQKKLNRTYLVNAKITDSIIKYGIFVMKKLGTVASYMRQNIKIKLEDGRDVK